MVAILINFQSMFKNLRPLNFFCLKLDRRFEEMGVLKPTAIFTSRFNEAQTLKDYKHYGRNNFERATNHSNLWKFLVALNTQNGLNNLNEFIDDFFWLESKYFALKANIDVADMYELLRAQLEHPKQQLNGHDGLRHIFRAALISEYMFLTRAN